MLFQRPPELRWHLLWASGFPSAALDLPVNLADDQALRDLFQGGDRRFFGRDAADQSGFAVGDFQCPDRGQADQTEHASAGSREKFF